MIVLTRIRNLLVRSLAEKIKREEGRKEGRKEGEWRTERSFKGLADATGSADSAGDLTRNAISH